jgi:hypothetical protein
MVQIGLHGQLEWASGAGGAGSSPAGGAENSWLFGFQRRPLNRVKEFLLPDPLDRAHVWNVD